MEEPKPEIVTYHGTAWEVVKRNSTTVAIRQSRRGSLYERIVPTVAVTPVEDTAGI